MFPRVPHPSATDILLCPFDLHVLGLPPAFVLSQDQTLKLYEILSRLSHCHKTDTDMVHISTSPKHIRHSSFTAQKYRDELKIRDRRFVPHERPRVTPGSTQGLPPSTFLFLPMQLSNSRAKEFKPHTLRCQPLLRPKRHPRRPSRPNPQRFREDASASAASDRQRRRRCPAYRASTPEPSSRK